MKQNSFEIDLVKMSRIIRIAAVEFFIVLIVVAVTGKTEQGIKWEKIPEDERQSLLEDIKISLENYLHKPVESIKILEAYDYNAGPDNRIVFLRHTLGKVQHITVAVIGKIGKPLIQHTHQIICT